MRLVRVQIQGFKRFLDSTSMDVSEDLVCVLGPNGAGKSSFLDALVYLNTDAEFGASDVSRATDSEVETKIEAKFELTSADRKVLTDVPESDASTHFTVHKSSDGSLKYSIAPQPKRDHQARRAAISALRNLGKSKIPDRVGEWEATIEDSPPDLVREALDSCEDTLATEEDDLDAASIASASELVERLVAFVEKDHGEGDEESVPNRVPVAMEKAIDALSNAVEKEHEEHPRSRAVQSLIPLVPRFLKFDEDSRDLRSEYSLNEDAEDPGSAIRNLLRLGGSSWEAAMSIAESGDMGSKKAWIESVDRTLEQKIGGAWGQQRLAVSVDIDGRVLRVFQEMESKGFIDIAWQSDGIRQFIALRTFIVRKELDVPPIVLIDEAEQHLHYDAQANLITVLEEQNDTAKIIYTTHSAGCLPRDIAAGTRGIAPIKDNDFSEMIDQFWAADSGLSPILIGMGAGAFAFSSARRALITEGFTDALVLPRLIREATGSPQLRYQVVPHFAQSSRDSLVEFDLVAARVAFVADGDEGGRENFRLLHEAGFDDGRLFFLGESAESGLSLEDLIDRDVFIDAVVDEVGAQKARSALTGSKQKAPGRWNWMKSVLEECDLSAPSKSAVAKRVMRTDRGQKILDKKKAKVLKDLDKVVWKVLK